jgi:HSP20 family protein
VWQVNAITQKSRRAPFTDIFDWLESPLGLIRPITGNFLPVEDYVRDDRYVLRAELPGVDPAKNLDVTVSDGVLSIKAERRDETEGAHRSEFRYDAFTRSVSLPVGADEEHAQAGYGNGILEVTVPLKGTSEMPHHVPVMIDKHIKPA